MASNLPPSITVNRNLASTLRAFIKQNGGKKVTEVQMNQILQRVAKFDAERDAGTREGGSIFDGGSRYLGGSGKDFRVKQGQQIQLSIEEYNAIFEGFIEPLKVEAQDAPPPPSSCNRGASKRKTPVPPPTPEAVQAPDEQLKEPVPEVRQNSVELDAEPTKNDAKPNINEQLDKNVKILFPNGLPEGVSANYVNIGGAPVLIFKKDGKTLDQSQLRELVKAQNQPAPKNEQVKDVEIPTPQTEQADDNKKTPEGDNTFYSKNGDKINLQNNNFNIEDKVLGRVSLKRDKVLEYITSAPSPSDLFKRASSAPVYQTENGGYKVAGQISRRLSNANAQAQNYASGTLYDNNKKYLELSKKAPEELTQEEKDFMMQHEVAMAYFLVSTEK